MLLNVSGQSAKARNPARLDRSFRPERFLFTQVLLARAMRIWSRNTMARAVCRGGDLTNHRETPARQVRRISTIVAERQGAAFGDAAKSNDLAVGALPPDRICGLLRRISLSGMLAADQISHLIEILENVGLTT